MGEGFRRWVPLPRYHLGKVSYRIRLNPVWQEVSAVHWAKEVETRYRQRVWKVELSEGFQFIWDLPKFVAEGWFYWHVGATWAIREYLLCRWEQKDGRDQTVKGKGTVWGLKSSRPTRVKKFPYDFILNPTPLRSQQGSKDDTRK